MIVFFFKQKTGYEMRISDWSSDVCSSDLPEAARHDQREGGHRHGWKQRHRPRGLGDGMSEAEQQRERLPGQPPERRAEADQVEQEGQSLQGHEIGRATCRERVCKYV